MVAVEEVGEELIVAQLQGGHGGHGVDVGAEVDGALVVVHGGRGGLGSPTRFPRAAGLVEPKAKVDAKQAAKLFENAKAVVVDLETGKIVAEGTGAELLASPVIKRAYLGGEREEEPEKDGAYYF